MTSIAGPAVLCLSVPMYLLALFLYVTVQGRNSLLQCFRSPWSSHVPAHAWTSQSLRSKPYCNTAMLMQYCRWRLWIPRDISLSLFFFQQQSVSNLWRVKSLPGLWLSPISLEAAFLPAFQVLTSSESNTVSFSDFTLAERFEFGNKLACPQ